MSIYARISKLEGQKKADQQGVLSAVRNTGNEQRQIKNDISSNQPGVYPSIQTKPASNFGEVQVFNTPSYSIQAKLTVNQPGDKYEQEADAAADKVTRNSIGTKEKGNSGQDSVSGKITSLTQPDREDTAVTSPLLNNKISASRGKGNSLDAGTGAFMSNCFGSDFSNVKIHNDNESAYMSRNLNAKAFTVGNDIYFNEGEYNLASQKGKHLLAHELTHTVQQNGSSPAVQKEDKDPTDKGKPAIDFKLLPPDLKLSIHHLLFEADTDHVQFDYRTRSSILGLSYKYGDALTLKLGDGRDSVSAGWVPGKNQFKLGLSGQGFGAGVTASPGEGKYGVGVHFGDKLLPMPGDMGSTFNKGGAAAGNMLTGVPGALDDPLAYYNLHKPDIKDIGSAIDTVKQISDQGKRKISFGADFAVTYDPINKVVVVVRAGLGGTF
ncbi:MAG: hypothetical protein JWQ57_14 [Mucilaginibacter sp.]|nr:hypothetical protein [Mucilaginibacter sp.]